MLCEPVELELRLEEHASAIDLTSEIAVELSEIRWNVEF